MEGPRRDKKLPKKATKTPTTRTTKQKGSKNGTRRKKGPKKDATKIIKQ